MMHSINLYLIILKLWKEQNSIGNHKLDKVFFSNRVILIAIGLRFIQMCLLSDIVYWKVFKPQIFDNDSF